MAGAICAGRPRRGHGPAPGRLTLRAFAEIFQDPVLFYYAAIAFNLWMIIDAVRRRAELYWLFIILLVPFGGVIYFALVKVKDYGLGKRGAKAPKRGQLAALKSQLETTPSLSNKLALADALEENDQCDDATPLYREALANDPDNKQALHGLARCAMSRQDFAEATELLDRLLRIDNAYRDYSAALDYAEALWGNGQHQDVIELLEGLTSVSRRMNHHMALAHYLVEDGRYDRARDVLENALELYQSSPEHVQKRDKQWASRAKDLKNKLPPVVVESPQP